MILIIYFDSSGHSIILDVLCYLQLVVAQGAVKERVDNLEKRSSGLLSHHRNAPGAKGKELPSAAAGRAVLRGTIMSAPKRWVRVLTYCNLLFVCLQYLLSIQ